ncbi:TPA: hypothetical protein PI395_002242 [Staphylococcus aureus]|nr:hypothetical protein [Staphylococcus aureus]HDH4519650.1 hypothetical protein [Staphylococcus aureus]HDH4530522.1 hypothetical protein [Staphylococcus aureus]HDH4535837.1 hypothetical protein [Staphylococcus aureus]HDH4622631.1 hypothetical protein [Staphylococcus aureus]
MFSVFLENTERFLSHYKSLTQLLISFITLFMSLGSILVACYAIYINQKEKQKDIKKKSERLLMLIDDETFMDRMYVVSRLYLISSTLANSLDKHTEKINKEIDNTFDKLNEIRDKISEIQKQKLEIITNNDLKKLIQKKESITLNANLLKRYNTKVEGPENKRYEEAIKRIIEIRNNIISDMDDLIK